VQWFLSERFLPYLHRTLVQSAWDESHLESLLQYYCMSLPISCNNSIKETHAAQVAVCFSSTRYSDREKKGLIIANSNMYAKRVTPYLFLKDQYTTYKCNGIVVAFWTCQFNHKPNTPVVGEFFVRHLNAILNEKRRAKCKVTVTQLFFQDCAQANKPYVESTFLHYPLHSDNGLIIWIPCANVLRVGGCFFMRWW